MSASPRRELIAVWVQFRSLAASPNEPVAPQTLGSAPDGSRGLFAPFGNLVHRRFLVVEMVEDDFL